MKERSRSHSRSRSRSKSMFPPRHRSRSRPRSRYAGRGRRPSTPINLIKISVPKSLIKNLRYKECPSKSISFSRCFLKGNSHVSFM
ncbi:hypothetical protein SOVF_074240 [Spinacia oleracea]|nr:hypothetical protein SOVF_074240 [Spinacia oleracea]